MEDLRVQFLKVRILKVWPILTGDSVENFAAGPLDGFTILLVLRQCCRSAARLSSHLPGAPAAVAADGIEDDILISFLEV